MSRKLSIEPGTPAAPGAAPQEFWRGVAARSGAAMAPGLRAEDGPAQRLHVPSRRRLPLQVTLNFGLGGCPVLQLRNLSTDGALIELGSHALAEGMLVELVLRCLYKDRPLSLHFGAEIVQVEGGSVLLRFGRYDDQTYTDLVNVMYAL